MDEKQEDLNCKIKFRLAGASKDLVILALVSIFVFVLSYFFNIFIVELFQKTSKFNNMDRRNHIRIFDFKYRFCYFSWRRWLELKKETAERLRLQEELVSIAETKAETERIICKQLHCIPNLKSRFRYLFEGVVTPTSGNLR